MKGWEGGEEGEGEEGPKEGEGRQSRKIGREGKEENFTRGKPTPRRETKGGRR